MSECTERRERTQRSESRDRMPSQHRISECTERISELGTAAGSAAGARRGELS